MYGYYGYGLYDPTMILVLIGAVLSLWASAKVKNTFNRYSSVRSMTGMTGAEAAQRLLNSQGIYDVTVRPVSGQLTDHYDPRTKTVNLSDGVYSSTSVAAIGVAAHECGHAIQDNVGYVPLRMRKHGLYRLAYRQGCRRGSDLLSCPSHPGSLRFKLPF